MKIELIKMTLSNFKVVQSATYDFGPYTVVRGDNETGKTTIYDAFLWCLFGKDSNEKKDFSIKPIRDNVVTSRLDNSVEMLLSIDGVHITLKRTQREKWEKPKGQPESEFKGHETLLEWNGVPMQVQQFKARVDDICKENVFKLITNVYAYAALPWQEKLKLLFEIVGEIKDADVATGNKGFEALIDELTGKTIAEYKREIAAKKKKTKEAMQNIPPRIDELERSKPEKIDLAKVSIEVAKLDKEILDLNEQNADVSKKYKATLDARKERLNEVEKLEAEQRAIKQRLSVKVETDRDNATKGVRDYKRSVQGLKDRLEEQREKNDKIRQLIADQSQKLETMRSEWTRINKTKFEFDPLDAICPVCKQTLENADKKRKDLEDSFNTNKANDLAKIDKEGIQLNTKQQTDSLALAEGEKVVIGLQQQIEDLENNAPSNVEFHFEDSLKKELQASKEYSELGDRIATAKVLVEDVAELDDKETTDKLTTLRATRDAALAKIAEQSRIDTINKRIKELEEEEKTLGQELATLEKQEFVAYNFAKAKADMLQQRIGDIFKLATFKTTNYLINGEEEQCCEIMYKGVPYLDVNHAGQINLGIDIINAISYFYGKTAPIFIDNAEAVNVLHQTDSQIIRLVVGEIGEQLTIKTI